MLRFQLGFLVLFGCVLAAAPASASLLIEIDKQTQSMTVSVDGTVRHTWPVSTGRAGYSTPSGSFKPFRLEEDHYSKEWDDAPMPHSIFFTEKGHAIHGSYETRKLGTPASAGCVRLAPANAARLFALVKEVGLGKTKVVIEGSEPLVAREPRRNGSEVTARRAPPRGEPEPRYYGERYYGERYYGERYYGERYASPEQGYGGSFYAERYPPPRAAYAPPPGSYRRYEARPMDIQPQYYQRRGLFPF